MAAIRVLTHISPTSLAAFSDCRQAWYWGYPGGLRPVKRQVALELGDGVHQALAAYYKAQMDETAKAVDPVRFFTRWADRKIRELETDDAEDISVLAHIRTMGIAMLENYVAKYTNDQFEILAVEREVTRVLPGTDWRIKVIIDAIIRDHGNYGKTWVLEHKTFSRFDESYLEKDHQFIAEAWCAKWLMQKIDPAHPEVEGTIWNGLRKQVPGPRVKNPLCERRYLPINDAQIAMFHKRARSMHAMLTQGRLAIYPEPSAIRCSYCSFKLPCTELQRGGDFQFLLDQGFTKRKDTEELEVEEA